MAAIAGPNASCRPITAPVRAMPATTSPAIPAITILIGPGRAENAADRGPRTPDANRVSPWISGFSPSSRAPRTGRRAEPRVMTRLFTLDFRTAIFWAGVSEMRSKAAAVEPADDCRVAILDAVCSALSPVVVRIALTASVEPTSSMSGLPVSTLVCLTRLST